jgi:hypothetical protein
MNAQHTAVARPARRLMNALKAAGLLAMTFAGLTAAHADNAQRTFHLEVYNGPLVARSECLVSGKVNERFGVGAHKKLEKFVLSGPGTHNKTVNIPSNYKVVRVECLVKQNTEGVSVKQKSGVAEQLIERQPLATQGVKAGCGSAAANASCGVNVVGI